ncbi:MAG: FecR domain-containing protein [Myxococcota bacterium]
MSSQPVVARNADAAVVARQWDNIEARLHGSPKSAWKRPAAAMLATAAAVAVLVLVWVRWDVDALPALMHTGPHAEAIELRDGSTMKLASYTVAEACSSESARACVEVSQGRVELGVPNAERAFEVRAGAFRVQARQAKFAVERDPEGTTTVSVQAGAVQLHTPEGEQTLSAGQTWSSAPVVAALVPPPPAPKLAKPTPRPDPREPEADREPEPNPPDTPTPRPSPPKAKDPDRHQQLWAAAKNARRTRDHAAAERALAEIVRRYPRDGLAALELGRLRMDALGDARGAIRPLQQSLRAKLGASFRDDATARLVRALDKVGRVNACRRTRDRYLADFPKGVHRNAVERACP